MFGVRWGVHLKLRRPVPPVFGHGGGCLPKFHDEFFRGTTSKHDQLVVDTINQVDKLIILIASRGEETETVNTYGCLDRRFCTQREVILEHPLRCSECSHVKTGNQGYSIAPRNFKPETRITQAKKTTQIKPYKKTIVTEKIYSNQQSGFIIGYADIVVKIQATKTVTLETSTKKVDREEDHLFYLVIDAKPTLQSWGGPLRQVKTYMRLEKQAHHLPVHGIITTYSTINETHRQVIEQENVTIVTIPEAK